MQNGICDTHTFSGCQGESALTEFKAVEACKCLLSAMIILDYSFYWYEKLIQDINHYTFYYLYMFLRVVVIVLGTGSFCFSIQKSPKTCKKTLFLRCCIRVGLKQFVAVLLSEHLFVNWPNLTKSGLYWI